jgi:hypothetical protein
VGDEDCQHYVLDGGPNDTFNLGLFTAKPDQKTIDFTVVVSEGPWQKLCEAKYVPEQPSARSTRRMAASGSRT